MKNIKAKLVKRMKGFTLLEILIVLGILSIFTVGVGTTWLGYRSRAELDSTARNIVDVLRHAQSNSVK